MGLSCRGYFNYTLVIANKVFHLLFFNDWRVGPWSPVEASVSMKHPSVFRDISTTEFEIYLIESLQLVVLDFGQFHRFVSTPLLLCFLLTNWGNELQPRRIAKPCEVDEKVLQGAYLRSPKFDLLSSQKEKKT